MKVRIGVSLGPATVPAVFGDAVDRVEALGVDSLWLPEMVFGSLVEPFAGMGYALSRTSRLKAGTGVAVSTRAAAQVPRPAIAGVVRAPDNGHERTHTRRLGTW